MHIVPAPAESLMKSRVLSIPGLQGVMDGLGMDNGFSDFRQGKRYFNAKQRVNGSSWIEPAERFNSFHMFTLGCFAFNRLPFQLLIIFEPTRSVQSRFETSWKG
mgnify:CR=1 FL=1